MGLSILFETAMSCDSILYTICVNSVAYKFLNTTSGTEKDDALAQMLRHCALLYRETAIAALKKISLMTRPSFPLLQALLCGVSCLTFEYCFIGINKLADFLTARSR